MSTVYNERTEPEPWRQAKIWKLLISFLNEFTLEFRSGMVRVTVKWAEHAFPNDLETVRVYVRKHFAKRSGFQPGAAHILAKLTVEKVASIRARCAAGESQMVIAKDLGVSNRTISDVWRGRTWRGA